MLKLTQVNLLRGTKVLVQDANLSLHRNQRIGLTGANGTGKSSIMALLRGELHADAGDVDLQGGITIAHVAQETPALDTSALDYALDGDQQLRQLQAAIADADKHAEHGKHSMLLGELESIDGYTAESRAARLLNGLGFSQEELSKSVKEFSGGWRMRLNLAQALMCRSDLLLLDEPTNHLDMDAILWLELWLKQYSGALILIAHDRDFLDSVCTHIAHIENQQLSVYTGGYSAFEITRAEKLSQQAAAFNKQQKEIAHIQSFINRFKAQATKAKQAQSRIKTLERMEKLALAHVDSPFSFQFLKPVKQLQHLLTLDKADIGYAAPIVKNARFNLIESDRIGLLGPNGAGKSTLIKCLAGELGLLGGTYQLHPDCKLGYFAQHQLEQLDDDSNALQHFWRLDKDKSEQELRDFLGGFGFQGDRATELVRPFSGGEKARLALALLVFQRPNLLLLDEPTNHLDLEMRHALSMALQDFEGAVVVISHDRHLLRSVCDELYIVHDHQLQHFKESLDDYPAWLAQQEQASAGPTANTANSNNKKQQRQLEAERRKQLKPLIDAVKKHEKTMDKHTKELAQIESQLADEGLYTEPKRKTELQDILKRQGECKNQLEDAEMQWLDSQEQLEAAE